ncbi:MAG: acyl carrier protein [Lachnospiraceae bacterium]|nr:acyl carrier protein [Lachnospiraceae bacterium]
MDELIELLEEIRPDVDFKTEEYLVDGGILDSFDIITIVGEMKDKFGIEPSVEDIVPEKFNSVRAMYELIQKYNNM